MKKWLVLMIVLCGAFLTSGCGLVDSYDERVTRYKQINNFQSRMLVDDWDYFWLYESNSKLTQYHPYAGQ